MSQSPLVRSLLLTMLVALVAAFLSLCILGCEEKPTGYEHKPPPAGGPPKGTSRRPPGEVNGPATR